MYTYRAKKRFCPLLETQYIQNPKVPFVQPRCPCTVPPPSPPPTYVWNPTSALGYSGRRVAYGNGNALDISVYYTTTA